MRTYAETVHEIRSEVCMLIFHHKWSPKVAGIMCLPKTRLAFGEESRARQRQTHLEVILSKATRSLRPSRLYTKDMIDDVVVG